MAQSCPEESQKNGENKDKSTESITSVELGEKQCVQLLNSEENGNSSSSKEAFELNGEESELHLENGQNSFEEEGDNPLQGLDGPPGADTDLVSNEEEDNVPEKRFRQSTPESEDKPQPPNGDAESSSEEPISQIMHDLHILGDKEQEPNISEGQENIKNNENHSKPGDEQEDESHSTDILEPCNGEDGVEGGESHDNLDESGDKILSDLPGDEEESNLDNGMEIDEGHGENGSNEEITKDFETSSKLREESDEDMSGIRIRDIGSLRDDSEEEDQVEISGNLTHSPKSYPAQQKSQCPISIVPTWEGERTPYVMIDQNKEDLSVQMLCNEENSNDTMIKEQRKKSTILKHQLVELTGMLKSLEMKGQPGINVRQPVCASSSPLPSGVKQQSLPPPTSQNSGTHILGSSPTTASRLVSRQIPSISQVNCVVTSRGIQQVPTPTMPTYSRPIRPHILNSGTTPSSQQIRSTGVSGNMHQIVFDPNTGLLLCPTTQTSTATTASQQFANANNRQSYRAIQAPPQFLAAMRSAGSVMVNGGPSLTRVVQPNLDLSQPVGINRNPGPSIMMASQIMRQQNPRQPTVTVMTPTSSAYGGQPLRTYQSIAPKSQQSYLPITTPSTPAFAAARLPAMNSGNSAQIRKPAPLQFRPTAPQAINKPRQPVQPPATAAPASASFIRKVEPPKVEKTEMTAGSQPPVPSINNLKEKGGQNSKTFPSLVVIVKPYLQEKLTKSQAAAVRSDLDAKVKTILMQSPVKFTEWLIQKGLLKMDHKCYVHNTAYKLGMYSDSEKYPYSGGYVFTVDCCPDKQLPVFQGSIFEASVYPPGTTMKLVYHWACQTPAPSVLQWVKVTSYYLKNFYTLLRSVCVAALHENASKMGGRGKYIEVGVVTLGTLPGTQPGGKQTKIEILGIFDPGAKFIRMRLLNCNPNLNFEDAKRERWDQILTPIGNWVNRDSVLLIDSTLEKPMIEKLGFRNVSQSKTPVGVPVKTSIPTNVNVMNYLKNIVPKMFQNTLCVLSKSLIQQFLDELAWRELWGSHPLKAFEAALSHLVGMTKADIGELLIPRLNKISLNPFAEWSYSHKTLPPPSGIECLPDSIRSQPLSELVASAVGMDSAISCLVSTYMNNPNMSSQSKSVYTTSPSVSRKMGSGDTVSKTSSNSVVTRTAAPKRKVDEDVNGLDLQKILTEGLRSHTLQAYYYIYCPPKSDKYNIEFPSNLKCPLCNKFIKSNNEALSHLISHVLSAGRLTQNPHGCRYCLKELATAPLLEQHINYAHKKLNEENVCRICADKYPSEALLILHMWKRHVNCEAPYRCEVCEYRTSFHYDAVDHFNKEHSATDTVQCPVCLKTIPVRSIACLKIVVTHLQNHALRKGKKCRDCCLSFFNDSDYRAHLLVDKAHETRTTKNFVQHEVEDTPIRMPKPPIVNKDLNIPPATKKTKSGRASGSGQGNLQTLNSSFAVPLNPSDKYMFTPMKVKISDVEMFAGMNCWECSKPISIPGHYRGTMKCSRCRFETCCSFTIHKHIKSHDINKLNQTVVRTKLALSREADLTSDALECSGCHFVSGSTRRFAYHLLNTGHKACCPKNAVAAATPSSSNTNP